MNHTAGSRLLALFVLVAGVVGGLFAVLLVLYFFKWCSPTKEVVQPVHPQSALKISGQGEEGMAMLERRHLVLSPLQGTSPILEHFSLQQPRMSGSDVSEQPKSILLELAQDTRRIAQVFPLMRPRYSDPSPDGELEKKASALLATDEDNNGHLRPRSPRDEQYMKTAEERGKFADAKLSPTFPEAEPRRAWAYADSKTFLCTKLARDQITESSPAEAAQSPASPSKKLLTVFNHPASSSARSKSLEITGVDGKEGDELRRTSFAAMAAYRLMACMAAPGSRVEGLPTSEGKRRRLPSTEFPASIENRENRHHHVVQALTLAPQCPFDPPSAPPSYIQRAVVTNQLSVPPPHRPGLPMAPSVVVQDSEGEGLEMMESADGETEALYLRGRRSPHIGRNENIYEHRLAAWGPPRKQVSSPLPLRDNKLYERGHIFSRSCNVPSEGSANSHLNSYTMRPTGISPHMPANDSYATGRRALIASPQYNLLSWQPRNPGTTPSGRTIIPGRRIASNFAAVPMHYHYEPRSREGISVAKFAAMKEQQMSLYQRGLGRSVEWDQGMSNNHQRIRQQQWFSHKKGTASLHSRPMLSAKRMFSADPSQTSSSFSFESGDSTTESLDMETKFALEQKHARLFERRGKVLRCHSTMESSIDDGIPDTYDISPSSTTLIRPLSASAPRRRDGEWQRNCGGNEKKPKSAPLPAVHRHQCRFSTPRRADPDKVFFPDTYRQRRLKRSQPLNTISREMSGPNPAAGVRCMQSGAQSRDVSFDLDFHLARPYFTSNRAGPSAASFDTPLLYAISPN